MQFGLIFNCAIFTCFHSNDAARLGSASVATAKYTKVEVSTLSAHMHRGSTIKALEFA